MRAVKRLSELRAMLDSENYSELDKDDIIWLMGLIGGYIIKGTYL